MSRSETSVGFGSPSPLVLPGMDMASGASLDEAMFPAAQSDVPFVPLTPPPDDEQRCMFQPKYHELFRYNYVMHDSTHDHPERFAHSANGSIAIGSGYSLNNGGMNANMSGSGSDRPTALLSLFPVVVEEERDGLSNDNTNKNNNNDNDNININGHSPPRNSPHRHSIYSNNSNYNNSKNNSSGAEGEKSPLTGQLSSSGSFRHPALPFVSTQPVPALNAAKARRPSMIVHCSLHTDADDAAMPYTPKEYSHTHRRGGSGHSFPDFGRLYDSEEDEGHGEGKKKGKARSSKKALRLLSEETETLHNFRLVQKRKSVSDLMAYMHDSPYNDEADASSQSTLPSHSAISPTASVAGNAQHAQHGTQRPARAAFNAHAPSQCHTPMRFGSSPLSSTVYSYAAPSSSQKLSRHAQSGSASGKTTRSVACTASSSQTSNAPPPVPVPVPFRRDRGFRPGNLVVPAPREDSLDPQDRLGHAVAKYIEAIDRFIRSRTNFYAPGYFFPIAKLFENVPPPKALKITGVPMFVKFLRFNDDEFHLSSNQKAVELLYLTPCRRENVRCYGYFHCVNQYCDTRWETDNSYTCEFQVCERCHTQVYPYRQDPLPEDYVPTEPEEEEEGEEEEEEEVNEREEGVGVGVGEFVDETETSMNCDLLHGPGDDLLGDLVDYVVDDYVEGQKEQEQEQEDGSEEREGRERAREIRQSSSPSLSRSPSLLENE